MRRDGRRYGFAEVSPLLSCFTLGTNYFRRLEAPGKLRRRRSARVPLQGHHPTLIQFPQLFLERADQQVIMLPRALAGTSCCQNHPGEGLVSDQPNRPGYGGGTVTLPHCPHLGGKHEHQYYTQMAEHQSTHGQLLLRTAA